MIDYTRIIQCRILTENLKKFSLKANDTFIVEPPEQIRTGDLILADIGGEIRIARYHDELIETADSIEYIFEILGKITKL